MRISSKNIQQNTSAQLISLPWFKRLEVSLFGRFVSRAGSQSLTLVCMPLQFLRTRKIDRRQDSIRPGNRGQISGTPLIQRQTTKLAFPSQVTQKHSCHFFSNASLLPQCDLSRHCNESPPVSAGAQMPLLPAPVPVSLGCLLYTSPSPRDRQKSRMPSSA